MAIGPFASNRKLLDAKGPIGDNVFKNPARYVSMQKRGL